MEKLRVGVIGVGQMGSLHARVYTQMPHVDLVAIADPQTGNCTRVAESLGVKHTFSNYQDLLKMKGIDAVSICTPDELHRDPVIAAAQAGKHIMLEKPLATNLKEAQEIVEVVNETKVKLMVGHLLRFDPRYALVKEAIDRGDLGNIIYIVSHRNSPYTEGPVRYKAGTSLTMHVAVHDLDLINWYTSSDAIRIYAESSTKMLKEKQMRDAVSAILKYENGAIASLNFSWVLPERSLVRLDARMEIVGTKGVAYIGLYNQEGTIIVTEKGAVSPDLYLMPLVRGEVTGALKAELGGFIDYVIGNRSSPVTGEEGLRAVVQASGIIQSIKEGKTVSPREDHLTGRWSLMT